MRTDDALLQQDRSWMTTLYGFSLIDIDYIVRRSVRIQTASEKKTDNCQQKLMIFLDSLRVYINGYQGVDETRFVGCAVLCCVVLCYSRRPMT